MVNKTIFFIYHEVSSLLGRLFLRFPELFLKQRELQKEGRIEVIALGRR